MSAQASSSSAAPPPSEGRRVLKISEEHREHFNELKNNVNSAGLHLESNSRNLRQFQNSARIAELTIGVLNEQPEGTVVWKGIGQLFAKSNIPTLKEELNGKKSMFEEKAQSCAEQMKHWEQKFESSQKEFDEYIKEIENKE